MNSVVSPLRYPGSKNKLYPYIKHLVEVNSTRCFIEPFVGGGSLACKLLLNGDVGKVIINDLDKSIYAFWYCVFFDTDRLVEKIRDTEITIEEWHKQKAILKAKDSVGDLLTLGFSMLFCNRTNRSGILTAGVIGGLKQDGSCKLDCRFNKVKIIEKIENLSKLKDRVEVYNLDVNELLGNLDLGFDTLVFLDPPYFVKGPDLYVESFKEACHNRLATTLKEELRDVKWVLTYDNASEVERIYEGIDNLKYYLNYSAARRVLGVENMFFSSVIDKGKYSELLKQPSES